MSAAQLNITVKKYATFRLPLQIKNGTGESATPADLTGVTPRMQVRASADDTEVLMEFTVANGRIVIVDAMQGQIELIIERAHTAAIGWTTGVYDLLLIDADDEGKRILEGTVNVSQGVTRI